MLMLQSDGTGIAHWVNTVIIGI